jgi:hypothetical protein
MNLPAGIPRSRGAVCGALLILLGLWGGLAPFVGPYFHFGITPDRAWAYNSGRLDYSIVPAAAVVLGGVLVLLTRNRAIGVTGGLLAVLGGAWFGLGTGFVTYVLKRTTITIGAPIGTPGAGTAVTARMYLEQISLFGGLSLLVVFFGALAVGRFSLLAAKDVAADDDAYPSTVPDSRVRAVATAATPFPSETDRYSPTGTFTQPSSAGPPAIFADPPPSFEETPPAFPDAPTEFPEQAP